MPLSEFMLELKDPAIWLWLGIGICVIAGIVRSEG